MAISGEIVNNLDFLDGFHRTRSHANFGPIWAAAAVVSRSSRPHFHTLGLKIIVCIFCWVLFVFLRLVENFLTIPPSTYRVTA